MLNYTAYPRIPELNHRLHVYVLYTHAPLPNFVLSFIITEGQVTKLLDVKLQTRTLWRLLLSLFPHFSHCPRCSVKSLYHPPSPISTPLLFASAIFRCQPLSSSLCLSHNPASLFAVFSFLIICHILCQWPTNYLILFSLLICLCFSVSLSRPTHSFPYFTTATLSNIV